MSLVSSQTVFAQPGNTGLTVIAFDQDVLSLEPTDPDGLDNALVTTGGGQFGGGLLCDTTSFLSAALSFHPLPWTVTLTDCQDPGDVTVWSVDVNGVITCIEGSCLPDGEPGPTLIGGELLPIETTSLLLANAQSFSWMIPVVLSGIGIGLFVVSRKSE